MGTFNSPTSFIGVYRRSVHIVSVALKSFYIESTSLVD